MGQTWKRFKYGSGINYSFLDLWCLDRNRSRRGRWRDQVRWFVLLRLHDLGNTERWKDRSADSVSWDSTDFVDPQPRDDGFEVSDADGGGELDGLFAVDSMHSPSETTFTAESSTNLDFLRGGGRIWHSSTSWRFFRFLRLLFTMLRASNCLSNSSVIGESGRRGAVRRWIGGKWLRLTIALDRVEAFGCGEERHSCSETRILLVDFGSDEGWNLAVSAKGSGGYSSSNGLYGTERGQQRENENETKEEKKLLLVRGELFLLLWEMKRPSTDLKCSWTWKRDKVAEGRVCEGKTSQIAWPPDRARTLIQGADVFGSQCCASCSRRR